MCKKSLKKKWFSMFWLREMHFSMLTNSRFSFQAKHHKRAKTLSGQNKWKWKIEEEFEKCSFWLCLNRIKMQWKWSLKLPLFDAHKLSLISLSFKFFIINLKMWTNKIDGIVQEIRKWENARKDGKKTTENAWKSYRKKKNHQFAKHLLQFHSKLMYRPVWSINLLHAVRRYIFVPDFVHNFKKCFD